MANSSSNPNHDAPTNADAVPGGGADSPPSVPGYAVHERIGEGAMGAVWRATQLSTQREVALKFLPESWLASSAMRRRFEREIEIAARLEHPNVARVYDSGLQHGGYYYAMEYVQGLALDRYIAEKQPAVKERLCLFESVCAAVQHAHINGIIHRDLKPSNILVTDDGVPYVLDFGLAKPTEETSEMTVQGAIAGTPQYMSPEQARGETDRLDTRTDVYSLGVVLYEMLTGHLPHPAGGGLVRLLRAIAETDATRPTRHVPGMDRDLEAILLKALAREREDRYVTADGLAADLRRFMQQLPVRARSMTPAYVARLWLRRNRFAVSVASLVAALLGLGGAVSVQRIRHERDVAQENFQMARGAVQEFFARLGDRGLDQQPGMSRLRRMLLGNARDFYEDLLLRAPDDLDVKVELSRILTVLAEQELALEDSDEAGRTLTRAMTLQQEVLAARPEDDWVAMMLALGHDRFARLALDEGDLAEARRHIQTALEMKQALCRRHPDDTQYQLSLAFGYRLAARVARRQGLRTEAEAWEQEGFRMNRDLLEKQPDDQRTLQLLARQWSDYAKILREQDGDIEAALQLQQKANAVNERLAGEAPQSQADQLALAYSYTELAKSFAARDDLALAIETELASMNLKRRLVAAAPRDPRVRRALLYSLHQLVQLYDRVSDTAAARQMLDAARDHVAVFSEISVDPVRTARTVAFFHSMEGLLAFREERWAEAIEAYNTSERMLTQTFGEHPADADVRTSLVCLGLFRLDVHAMAGGDRAMAEIAEVTQQWLDAWREPTRAVRYYAARLQGLRARKEAISGNVEAAQELADAARAEFLALLADDLALPEDPNRDLALRALGIETVNAPVASAPRAEEDALNQRARPPDLDASGESDTGRFPARVFQADDIEALIDAAGLEATVEGGVTSCAWNQNRTHFFINFGERGAGFYGLIYEGQFESFAAQFGPDLEDRLSGRKVRLHGTLQRHRGMPQIVLTWPQQMELLGDVAPAEWAWQATSDILEIDWRDAAAHVGDLCRVRGWVVSTGRTEHLCYLDFTDRPDAAGRFHLPILPGLFDAWPEPPERHFFDKHIRVTGRITRHRGIPQIVIEHADQIEILAP